MLLIDKGGVKSRGPEINRTLMKKLWTILLVVLASCVSSSKVQEGVFYKTKFYVGTYENSTVIDDKFTMVLTSYGYFKLKENPDIPDSSFCYVRVEPPSYDFHPDIAEQMTAKYFTWNGHDLEYRIFNEIDSRKIRAVNRR